MCPYQSCNVAAGYWKALMSHYTVKHSVLEANLRESFITFDKLLKIEQFFHFNVSYDMMCREEINKRFHHQKAYMPPCCHHLIEHLAYPFLDDRAEP